jgi:hypothetical protein
MSGVFRLRSLPAAVDFERAEYACDPRVILLVLWLLGFFAFHVTTAAIHVLLLVALVVLVLHFVRGRRTI